jgi:integrase
MPQAKKPYLRCVRSKSGREYFYNSQTGTAYGSDREIAEARFAEWLADDVPSKPITQGSARFEDAVFAYYKSDAFLVDLKPRTRDLYRGYIEQLRGRFGSHRLAGFDQDFVLALRDRLKAQPSKCYQTLAVLQIVLNVAIARRWIPAPNPVVGVKRIKSEPRDAIWTQEQIETFLAAARPSLRLAIQLLLYTAQRPSDVLAMTKGQVCERGGRLYISMRQEKTGALIDVPVHAALDPALRARLVDPAGGLMLVPSPTGLMWSRRNFSRAWDQARRAAKLPALQRRDLRRTAVVNMAVAGLPVPQIAAITGHSLKSVEDILRVYLPRRTEVALAGIAAWEAAAPPKLDNVVALAAKRGRA